MVYIEEVTVTSGIRVSTLRLNSILAYRHYEGAKTAVADVTKSKKTSNNNTL
jgi:hypothetical protein